MKTLEKLKLHNLEEICVEDQKTMLGGSGSEPNYGSGTMLQEVVCYGYRAPVNPFMSYYDPYYAGYIPGSNSTTYGSGSNSGNSGGGGESTGTSVAQIIPPASNVSTSGLNFIKSWEIGPQGGVALTQYDDNGSLPGGNMTIGWGHLIKAGENFSNGITLEQANAILMADLERAISDVKNSVHVSLTQCQFDALVSYSFNTGPLSGSPELLSNLNSSHYYGAAQEMDIVTSGGVTLPGLVQRRADERNMFSNGVYNNHN